jgi:hypothetical protein
MVGLSPFLSPVLRIPASGASFLNSSTGCLARAVLRLVLRERGDDDAGARLGVALALSPVP